MALLNPPQILPNVAQVLFRALQAADEFALSRDDLAKAVAPAALPRGEAARPGHGSKGFDDTLFACQTIGLFERDSDVIRLHPDLPDSARDRRIRDSQLPSLIRDLVLAESINRGVWDSTEGARDLSRALAWYLAQNPLRPPGPWNEPAGVQAMEERQFTGGERVFSNDTRWGAFDRWATFLGFGRHLPSGGKDVLVPDPTDALRKELPSVLAAQRSEIGGVVDELGQRLPVLDGGAYRREVEARLTPDAVQNSAELISPSLAYALLRLRDQHVIILEDLADAPLKMRLPDGFGPERTITHASLPSSKQGSKR
jgi:hypothetical protein